MVKQKRKVQANSNGVEDDPTLLSLEELHEDLLERILSWLPTPTYFRARSVSKRWRSAADSATFKIACSQVPSREPWFFMVDSQFLHQQSIIVYDSCDNGWKKLIDSLPFPVPEPRSHNQSIQSSSCFNFIPVAASGALLCFKNGLGDFIVWNPVTGTSRQISSLDSKQQHLSSEHLGAIAMVQTTGSSSSSSYKLVSVSGESPALSFREYSSETEQWGEDVPLNRKNHCPFEPTNDDENSMYFLSKCGNVVSPNSQRSPCKRYSSVLIQKEGEQTLYFLSSTGIVIVCNLTLAISFEYPRILPVNQEFSIDLIQCQGEMMVVVLSEFLESASLRVWRFDEDLQSWQQVVAMPPAIAQEFYGKKVDINCTAAGQQILVCFSSPEICRYFLCDLAAAAEWVELGNFIQDGKKREFVCAFAFEPRIEAAV